uniref:tRNA methyltransferase 10 homolog C n=1 Tax=Gouania willdenowi TaxID=441366 RepID=A0A8C5GAH0_GOUWI
MLSKRPNQRNQTVKETMIKERSDEEDGQRDNTLKNTLFLTFWSRSLDKFLAWRSASAMMYGQPLVFDMRYDSHMSRRELENAVSQLMEVEGWNRRAAEPYHLHFCNLQHNGPYMQELLKRYGEETWNRLFITTTHRQHVEVFPREQLVYLTADSPNVLRKYDHNKVYIIGAMVDRSIQSGVSLAQAKRLKLNTARLPLDEYLYWDIGAKNLTLDQMIRIMLTIKNTGKWEEALKFVPKRKHDGFHQERTHYNSNNRGTPSPEWRNQGKTVQNVYRKNSGFIAREKKTGYVRGENASPGTKIRTLLKSTLEARKSAGSKEWWKDE